MYFSPQVPSSKLLPDGTDPLQSPGEPFVRRMWAGGSLLFDTDPTNQVATDNQRLCCTESISDVSVKGSEGDEKVFVTINRQIGKPLIASIRLPMLYKNPWDLDLDYLECAGHTQNLSPWAVLEKRNLVFMRQKSAATAKEDAARPGKVLKRMSTYTPLSSCTSTAIMLTRLLISHNLHTFK